MHFYILLALIFIFFWGVFPNTSQNASAQVEVEEGDFELEIGGRLTTYYNYRFYEDHVEDRDKNRFRQRDGRIEFEGEYGDFEFELQYDFAAPFGRDLDPIDHPLKDAYLVYDGWDDIVEVQFGFTKTPYSHTSLVSFRRIPFNQRAEFARNEAFTRRDIGVTLKNEHWDDRFKWWAGTYTGRGVMGLDGDNDESGTLEYIGRAELAYPEEYQQREVDLEYTETPGMKVGLNARHAEKGETIDLNYGLFTIDGTKITYGGDLHFRYRGFSAQLEAHQMHVEPRDTMRMQGFDTDFFRAGGYLAQLNYVIKPLNTFVAARYDEFNPNDLIFGNTKKNLSGAIGYMIDGHRTYIKAHYWHRLDQEFTGRPWQPDQFRIAFVHEFF